MCFLQANLAFGTKLVRALKPFMMGPKVWFFTSTTASANFMAKAKKTVQGAQGVVSLQNGIPESVDDGDICIVMAPSVRQDYMLARSLAATNPVIIVNGLAKVCLPSRMCAAITSTYISHG